MEDQFFYQRMIVYLAAAMFVYMMLAQTLKEIKVVTGLQKYCISCQ